MGRPRLPFLMTSSRRPSVVVIAGPNGAGKSTVAPLILRGPLDVREFVNADDIARGLSPFNIEGAAVTAGRIMLSRIRDLARQRVSFAFETTLASRTFAPWLQELKQDGYTFHLVFLWLPSPEVAAARVADRVRLGGHSIPDETIRRRYHGGVRNFFRLYRPIATTWVVYDSSHPVPRLIAEGEHGRPPGVSDTWTWSTIVGASDAE
jgi:predicted ABC-type ATPase